MAGAVGALILAEIEHLHLAQPEPDAVRLRLRHIDVIPEQIKDRLLADAALDMRPDEITNVVMDDHEAARVPRLRVVFAFGAVVGLDIHDELAIDPYEVLRRAADPFVRAHP